MKDIERCTKCILPGSLPSVKLDKDGVCNHCKTYDSLYGNWEDVKAQKKGNTKTCYKEQNDSIGITIALLP